MTAEPSKVLRDSPEARTCQVCEQAPAAWHLVTIIDHGRHRIEGDYCEECGDDVIEAELYDEAVRL